MSTKKVSEQVTIEFQRITHKANLRDRDFRALLRQYKSIGKPKSSSEILLTQFWAWLLEDKASRRQGWLGGDRTFWNDPPVVRAKASDAVLLCGCWYEIDHFKNLIETGTEIELTNGERLLIPTNTELRSVSTIGFFWSKFYGEDEFLDQMDRNVVPKLIVTSGTMRDYDHGGMYVSVADRLLEIAKQWNIKFVHIPLNLR